MNNNDMHRVPSLDDQPVATPEDMGRATFWFTVAAGVLFFLVLVSPSFWRMF